MSEPASDRSDEAVERPMTLVISLQLMAGVALSALLIALGILMMIVTGHTGYDGTMASPTLLLSPESAFAYPRTVTAVVQGALAWKPLAVIELGLLLLIATPVVRVAASIVLFWREMDYQYVVITTAVFAVLLISIFWIS